MTSIPMHYPQPVPMHQHDIVFHQMLRSAQLPSAIPFRPERPSIDVYARLERRAALAARRVSQSSEDSDVDDGYYADRDNEPSKLLKGASSTTLIAETELADLLRPNRTHSRM